MTEEEFREIIKPIGLIGKKENRTFIETALIGNFKMWLEDKQALDLASVVGRSEQLPIFLYRENGEIFIGYEGDSLCTDEWNKWLKNR